MLSALSERLHKAVVAQPGETMAVLAPGLGCSPRELHRPMAVLKQAGRVRSVGQRHQTRYYPSVRAPRADQVAAPPPSSRGSGVPCT